MAFSYKNDKGETYYLHHREETGRSGQGEIYFFSKEEGEEAIDDLPEGYEVVENEKTGLPVLKKKD